MNSSEKVEAILSATLPGMTGEQEQRVYQGEEALEGVHSKVSRFEVRLIQRDIRVEHDPAKRMVVCSRGAFMRGLSAALNRDSVTHTLEKKTLGTGKAAVLTYVLTYEGADKVSKRSKAES